MVQKRNTMHSINTDTCIAFLFSPFINNIILIMKSIIIWSLTDTVIEEAL